MEELYRGLRIRLSSPMSLGCRGRASAQLDGLLRTALRKQGAGRIALARGSDAVESGRLPPALGGEGEAARSRPLWQPYNTAAESNAAGLRKGRLDSAGRRHH